MSIGTLALSPSFNSAELEYTTTTTKSTNTITATPAGGYGVRITVNGKPHENGAPATWLSGDNIVRIAITKNNAAVTPAVEYVVIVTKTGGTLGSLTVTSAAGTETGTTAISVAEPLTPSLSRVYKTGATVALPSLDDDLAAWTAWDGTGDVTATADDDIVVAEVLTIGEKLLVKKAGTAKVVSAE